MIKLEELSIADIKAIHDYANNLIKSELINTARENDYWTDVRHSAKILIEARIKQIFKP